MSSLPAGALNSNRRNYQPKSKAATSPFSLGKVVINIVPIFSTAFLRVQLANSKEKVKVMGKRYSLGLQLFLGLLSL